jgi:small redox-active disulfide protein 2
MSGVQVQILGPGCANCKKLAENVQEAARQAGIDCEVEKITDITVMTRYGLTRTPGLALYGDLKVQGRVPSVAEIKALLEEESSQPPGCSCSAS